MGADRAGVVSFGLVAVAQAMFPLWAYHPAAAGLRVHLSNGLYANAVFDRLIGGWSAPRALLTLEGRPHDMTMTITKYFARPATELFRRRRCRAARQIPPVWPLASSSR
jgi:hypothetical protein